MGRGGGCGGGAGRRGGEGGVAGRGPGGAPEGGGGEPRVVADAGERERLVDLVELQDAEQGEKGGGDEQAEEQALHPPRLQGEAPADQRRGSNPEVGEARPDKT